MKTLLIMRGLQGSGKSTLAAKLSEADPSSTICSADDFFMKDGAYEYKPHLIGAAHAECWNKFKTAVDAGIELVIIDNTSITHDNFRPYAAYASKAGYLVATVVAEEWDVEKCAKRNRHECPREVIASYARRFER